MRKLLLGGAAALLLAGCPADMDEETVALYYVVENSQDVSMTLESYVAGVDTVHTLSIPSNTMKELFWTEYLSLVPSSRGATSDVDVPEAGKWKLSELPSMDLDSLFLITAKGDTMSAWRSGDVITGANTATIVPYDNWCGSLASDTYLGVSEAYIMRF